jgi:cytochrome c oxidase cbb3-type subunit I
MSGTVFYALVCTQGPIQALRAVNAIVHFTDWVIGHAHMALFGTFTFFSYAAVYYAIPRVYKRPLYSEGIAEWHFWLSFIGFWMFSVALWYGGFLQGLQWEHPEITFVQTVQNMMIYWHIRAAGGMMMLTGMYLFAFNVYKTATSPAPVATEQEILTAEGRGPAAQSQAG